MATPSKTRPLCRDCKWWEERLPEGGIRIGWCDFNHPEENRGIKTWRQTCKEWARADRTTTEPS